MGAGAEVPSLHGVFEVEGGLGVDLAINFIIIAEIPHGGGSNLEFHYSAFGQ